jgi:hypothetical protein
MEDNKMADNDRRHPVHAALLDNHFLLLFLGVASPRAALHPVGHHRHHEHAARQVISISHLRENYMSAILPPSNRLWWKQPIDKVEWAWIGDRLRLGDDHVRHDDLLAHLR